MVGSVIALVAAMFAGFRWMAATFDKVSAKIGRIDKKKGVAQGVRAAAGGVSVPN